MKRSLALTIGSLTLSSNLQPSEPTGKRKRVQVWGRELQGAASSAADRLGGSDGNQVKPAGGPESPLGADSAGASRYTPLHPDDAWQPSLRLSPLLDSLNVSTAITRCFLWQPRFLVSIAEGVGSCQLCLSVSFGLYPSAAHPPSSLSGGHSYLH